MKTQKNSKQFLWFVGIWVASVTALFLLAQLIRWLMPE
ncbi:DUF2474 family protein [Marinicella sp. W31]